MNKIICLYKRGSRFSFSVNQNVKNPPLGSCLITSAKMVKPIILIFQFHLLVEFLLEQEKMNLYRLDMIIVFLILILIWMNI